MSNLPSFLAKYLSNTASGIASRSVTQPISQSWREATSLRSYFADLLAYTLKHLRKNTGGGTPAALTAAELSALLHQPFEALLTSGGAAERPIRQIRLAIEAMRLLLGNRPLSDLAKENALSEAETVWQAGAYDAILSLLGVPAATMGNLNNADETTRKALAARLGIALEKLAEFYQPAASITEIWLEQHFGLSNTLGAGFSTGVKIGDTNNQIVHWELEGFEWDTCTDSNGLVYLRLSKPNASTFLVEVFKDANRSILLASGSNSTAQGMVTLSAYEGSNVSGVIRLNYATGGTGISIAVIPKLLAYRYQFIRQRWQALYAADDTAGLKFLNESFQNTRQNLEEAIGKAELYGLPALRDALTTATGQGLRPLSERLLLDCEFDASFITSRTAAAIAALQQLLGGLRTGLLQDTFPSLQFQRPEFDEEWTWLSTYENWKSAILVFLYPENALEPTLQRWQTPAFRGVVEKLRGDRQLSQQMAADALTAYAAYFRDINALEVAAVCGQKTFGIANGQVYWTEYGSHIKDETGLTQAPWEKIPGFEKYFVRKIIGVLVYRQKSGANDLFLFGLVEPQKGFVLPDETIVVETKKMAFSTYSLKEKKWSGEAKILLDVGHALDNSIVLEQRMDEKEQPHFVIQRPGGIFSRRLSEDGLDWDDIDWKELSSPSIKWIHGLVKSAGKSRLLVTRTNSTPAILTFTSSGIDASQGLVTIGKGVTFGVFQESDERIWRFGQDGDKKIYNSIEISPNGNITIGTSLDALPGLSKIAVHHNIPVRTVQVGNNPPALSKGFELSYTMTGAQQGQFRATFVKKDNYTLDMRSPLRLCPTGVTLFDLSPSVIPSTRRQEIAAAFVANTNTPLEIVHYLWEAYYFFPVFIAQQWQRSRIFPKGLDYFRMVYDYAAAVDDRKIFYGLQLENSLPLNYERAEDWLNDALNPHEVAATRKQTYTRYTILALVRCFLQAADAEFTKDTAESLASARSYYAAALELLDAPELQPQEVAWGLQFDVPTNPYPELLRYYAELNLYKLHNGRNIAGDEREIPLLESGETLMAPMSSLNASTSMIAPTASVQRPTPYRFAVLLERAKQLAGMAQQMEAAFLSALEKLDSEQLQALNAKHELQTAKATVRLQDLRVKEARDGVRMAELQKEKSKIQVGHFDTLLKEGMLETEKKILEGLDFAITGEVIGAISSAFYNPIGFASNVLSGLPGITSKQIEQLQIKANYERKRQDWQLELNLSTQDAIIARQQILLSQDQVQIVGQERNIAALRSDQAASVANFLATKFTNADLYDFISEVLEGVYGFFLQQATATAQLAAQQLAFERQEPVPAVVLGDYWTPPSLDGASSGENPDRRGMTGSARLLRDIQRLDQIAFQTDQRKLQLSKNISLAQLSPVEFQRFRETGVLPIHIPMEAFDRDFPGHYLRLIRQVKVSLLALVPPVEGVKATLTHNGISRVVLPGNGQFTETIIRRSPESIAFTAPLNANGLFEMQSDPSKLLPFESMGVDGFWELQLPKAANQFDYNTIADVLITIDYTALYSDDYRRRVIANLDRRFSADRAFSFRREFPDQWYDLNHPEQSNEPMVVQFETLRGDFPANIEGIQIKHAVLYFVRKDGFTKEIDVIYLRFQPQGGVWLGDSAVQNLTTIEGILSTRTGSFSDWDVFRGKIPVGQWSLALQDSTELRQWFRNEQIEDVLFVLSFEGETAKWT